jgi:hypothetical protein
MMHNNNNNNNNNNMRRGEIKTICEGLVTNQFVIRKITKRRGTLCAF